MSHHPEPHVVPGDLWTVGRAGDETMAVICAARDDYALVLPVTGRDQPAFAPAVPLTCAPLQDTVHVWPTRETTIGQHLLRRRLGTLLDAATLTGLVNAVDAAEGYDVEGPIAHLPAAGGSYDSGWDEWFVDLWGDLCFDGRSA